MGKEAELFVDVGIIIGREKKRGRDMTPAEWKEQRKAQYRHLAAWIAVIFISFFVLGLIVGSCTARAEDWRTADQVAFGAQIGLQVIDTLQTREARKHPERWREVNPLYGDPPGMGTVVVVKTLYVGTVWYLLDKHTASADRGTALWVLNAMAAGVVLHNHHIGVRIEF